MSKPLILHAHGMGPNPFKVAIILEGLGIPYEVRLWQFGDNDKNGVKGKTMTAMNLNGRVPVLEDPNTGVTSWESLACVNYLLRVYDKQNKYGPADNEQDRVDSDKWVSLLISTAGPFQGKFLLFEGSIDQIADDHHGTGQVNWFKHFHPTKEPSALARYEEQTYRCYQVVENHLQQQKSDYFLKKGFTHVDAHWYSWVHISGFAGLSLEKYPLLNAWHERCSALKEVADAYATIPKGKEM